MVKTAEVSKEVQESFRKAGLGAKYFHRSLTEFGELGKGLSTWLNSNDSTGVAKEIATGGGRSLYGSGVLAHDVFMILARGVHARGFAVKIISLSVLARQLDADEMDPAILGAPALFLHPFYDPDLGELPITKWQRLSIEEVLQERMDNSKSNFTLARRPLEEAKAWWSRYIIAGLNRNNVEIGVKVEDISKG